MSDAPLRVLLVEDDADDYLVVRRVLGKAFGDAVALTWADRYEEARQAMDRGEYDLYLIDYRLGAQTGIDLLRVLQERADTTPAILLTGVGDHEIDVLATAAGASDYLVKEYLDAPLLERAIRYARMHAQIVHAVRTSEQHFRSLIEHSSDGIALLGSDYTIRYASPSTTRILGYTPEEFVRCALIDLIHPDDRPRVARTIAAGPQADGTLPTREVRMRHKDGTYRCLEYVGTVLFTDPTVEAIVVNYRDVTERKSVEATLWLHERAVAAATSGIVIADARVPDCPLIYVNAGFEHLTGYTAAESRGRNCRFLQGPDTDAATRAHLHDAIAAGEARRVVLRNYRKDGTPFWNELVLSPVRDEVGLLTHFIGVQEDVSARMEADDTLRESERRARLQYEGNPIATYTWQRVGDEWVFTDYNAAADRQTSGKLGVLVGATVQERFRALPDVLADFIRTAREHVITERETRWTFNEAAGSRDVCNRFVWIGPDLVTQYVEDISERVAAERQLVHNALHDALTTLPNRALFADRVTNALQRAKRNPDRTFAVLFVDLDRFKTVNDSLGHPMGDHLLVEAARRIQSCLRGEDTLARFGGDEFAILLEEVRDVIGVSRVTEQIQHALAVPIVLRGHTVVVSASIGIVLAGRGYSAPENVLRDADIAMYRAKGAGVGRHAVFDRAMHAQAIATLQTEGDLRQGLRREEFTVVYQPIVSLDTGEIAGFEALIRWNHPRLGRLAPAEFVPVAEESGLIVSLDRWTLREACTQVGRWQRAGIGGQANANNAVLSINVNVSARHFAHEEGLVSDVIQAVAESGIAPAQLRLEITESALIAHAVGAMKTLAQLRARGVQVAMDDFGVGQSSLSNLRRFPIDTLKIDRSFIAALTATVKDAEMVRAIVTMGRGLGMQVVAEGIETDTQWAQLQALGCEMGQGYLFGKPMNAEEAGRFLVARAAMRGDAAISP